jgi:outer membrane usher protein
MNATVDATVTVSCLPGNVPVLRRNLCTAAILTALYFSAPVYADEAPADEAPAYVQFDTSFLKAAGQTVDLSRFDHGNVVFPGVHTVTIAVRNGWQGQRDVLFKVPTGQSTAAPCFDRSMLQAMGVNFAKLPKDRLARIHAPGAVVCGNLARWIPHASYHYDSALDPAAVFVKPG